MTGKKKMQKINNIFFRMQLSKRFGDRSTVSLLSQDESDGALSAPEMPTRGTRGITS